MPVAAASIEISRRPQDVFEYVLDPLYYSQWDDSVVAAQRSETSPLAVGSKTTVLHWMGPFKVRTTEELVALDPPRQFTNRGVSGPLAGIATCTVEPLDGGRASRVTITLDIEARGIGKLLLAVARPRARRAIPGQLKKLKKVLEGGAGRSPQAATSRH